MNEENEIKSRNTDKKRIAELESQLSELQSAFSSFADGVIHTFHVVGAPHDILLKHGIKPYKVKEVKKTA